MGHFFVIFDYKHLNGACNVAIVITATSYSVVWPDTNFNLGHHQNVSVFSDFSPILYIVLTPY